eukprot:TRINITY_DN2171_c0_g1_i2.p1 TRINITY_DN2171_c0_g1~~TRINITY_DN2171_c0_g1_i2.p1  ORF type:complete len:461 (-),score=130.47 TRINITY_DN2171_c0_g1_i2:22-1404(-)
MKEPKEPREWRLTRIFGADDTNDEDSVSTVDFDRKGEFLAAGDRQGRVVLFKKTLQQTPTKTNGGKKKSSGSKSPGTLIDYQYYHEFKSHAAEFDCFKTVEVEPKINRVKFLPRSSTDLAILTTNDRTIKLWKVTEKRPRSFVKENHSPTQEEGALDVDIPHAVYGDPFVTANCRKLYNNAHAFAINSISLFSDQETFLSADDLRINLWNMGITNQSFNILDIKPADMQQLSEVITCAECHPLDCSLFAYATSSGYVHLVDLRARACCEKSTAKEFFEPCASSFFSEILSSVSDMKFSRDGRYIVTRSFLQMKIWDVAMDKKPLKTVQIHDNLKSRLVELYESDAIYDKFECAISCDGNQVVSGSYSSALKLFSVAGKGDVTIQACRPQAAKSPSNSKLSSILRKKSPSPPSPSNKTGTPSASGPPEPLGQKVLHLAFNPVDNVLAVARGANMYLFQANL